MLALAKLCKEFFPPQTLDLCEPVPPYGLSMEISFATQDKVAVLDDNYFLVAKDNLPKNGRNV